MVRMMSTEPSVFSPGKRLQWLTPSAKGMYMIPVVRGVLSLLLAMAMVVFAAGNAMSDHDIQTYTFVFTGSPIARTPEMKNFTIHNDGAFYFKLKSATPAGTTANPITVGFFPTTNPNTCSDRYISRIENPTVGQNYGPYYMEAGTYKSYYYHSLGVATTYELEIEYYRQLTPNDVEPNESLATASDIGNISPNDHITGHLGYLGCKQNKHDYIRFGMLSSGNYRVNIHYDPTFSAKPGCVVWFNLYDETAGSWPLSHTGPKDVTLGPIAFQAGRDYIVSMESSSTCYDIFYEGGGAFVVGNKAGAYDIQIYDPNAPPATISINYGTGGVGSFITLRGAGFPPNSQVKIVVNNSPLSPYVLCDGSGNFLLVLSTNDADYGIYNVSAVVASRSGRRSLAATLDTVSFLITSGAPVRAREAGTEGALIIAVPAHIALPPYVILLPLIQK